VADDRAFLGTGLAFPLQLNGSGDVAMARYDEDIRQAVLLILETEPGERVMRPSFGAGLGGLVFEPLNTTTEALAQHRVETALVKWEPRIDIIKVQVNAVPHEGRLDIEIRYRVRTTNTFYNLVYPFYLQEGQT
jgi:phage baseplate assembly protein W